jgi:hypothetical protein
MPRFIYEGVVISYLGAAQPVEAIVVAHGWYQSGWRMFGGTGTVLVPYGWTINWYCAEGASVPMGIPLGLLKRNDAERQASLARRVDISLSLASVTNYYLGHKRGTFKDVADLNLNTQIGNTGLITIRPGKPQRLAQIIKGIQYYKVPIRTIHFCACRDKLGLNEEPDLD